MAVTLDYIEPTTASSTTPPTAAQMSKLNEVTVTITKTADGDATTTLTHNMNISDADLAAGYPIVELEPSLANFYTTQPFVASKTANTVVITLGTGGGSGDASPQITARMRRPTSKEK